VDCDSKHPPRLSGERSPRGEPLISRQRAYANARVVLDRARIRRDFLALSEAARLAAAGHGWGAHDTHL
jgi:hypothetical protein